jgi:hypothetical protein
MLACLGDVPRRRCMEACLGCVAWRRALGVSLGGVPCMEVCHRGMHWRSLWRERNSRVMVGRCCAGRKRRLVTALLTFLPCFNGFLWKK